MQAQKISSDRLEIQVNCRDLARKMQQPPSLDEVELKRLARHPGVRPSLIWLFKWQKRVTRVESWLHPNQDKCFWLCVDATYCKGQAVIALSSGEAECYWLVSATSQMLGLQSILLDWRWKFHAHVWMDATAGIAIGGRRGLGRVKHIDTVFLWAQTMVTEGKVTLGKKPTKEMLADFLTKRVDAATMLNCMTGLGMKFQSGESTDLESMNSIRASLSNLVDNSEMMCLALREHVFQIS